LSQDTRPYKAGYEVIDRYPVDTVLLIRNAWLPNGKQIIKDGTGFREYEVWGTIRIYEYKNGNANGTVEYWDTTKAILLMKGFCINGLPDSSWTEFYKGEKIKSSFTYINGKIVGEYKTYYENGKLKSIGSYKNNCPDGEWLLYLENGKLDKKITYENCKEKI